MLQFTLKELEVQNQRAWPEYVPTLALHWMRVTCFIAKGKQVVLRMEETDLKKGKRNHLNI